MTENRDFVNLFSPRGGVQTIIYAKDFKELTEQHKSYKECNRSWLGEFGIDRALNRAAGTTTPVNWYTVAKCWGGINYPHLFKEIGDGGCG